MENFAKFTLSLEPYIFNRQSDLTIYSSEFVFNSIISPNKDLEITFQECDNKIQEEFEKNFTVTFAIKTLNNKFLSKVTMRVSLISLGANFPELSKLPFELLADRFKECLNQILGIVNLNLNKKLDSSFRIGLPEFLASFNSNKDESTIIPGSRIIDSTKTFEINFGCVRIRGEEEIDLKGIRFKNSNSACGVEFL